MMNLGRILVHLYPAADDSRDYIVRIGEDGEAYIAEWNMDAPRPTKSNLDAAALATAKQIKRIELQAAFARECEADFGPMPWVAVAVLASNPIDARITALKARATKLRDRLASVDAAASVADVEAVRW